MLAPPALKMLYEVAGRRLLVETQDDWSAAAIARLFAGWFLTPLSSNGNAHPDATLRITCGSAPPPVPDGLIEFEIAANGVCSTDGRTFYLDLSGSLVVIGPDTNSEVKVWVKPNYDFSSVRAQVVSQAFSAALRRCGLYEFHSAGVRPPKKEKAVLIAGASGSGKSTLTLQLAVCGWSYLSDDTLLLSDGEHGIEARGLRRFFALTADTIAASPLRLPRPTDPGPFKERLAPNEFFPSGQIQCASPGAIFFPVITNEDKTEVRSLTASETMVRLLRLSPWACYDKPTANGHINILGKLARETVAFDIRAGTDLLENPTRASDLLLATARI